MFGIKQGALLSNVDAEAPKKTTKPSMLAKLIGAVAGVGKTSISAPRGSYEALDAKRLSVESASAEAADEADTRKLIK